MLSPIQIEEAYKQFVTDLGKWVHDQVQSIDLKFLHDTGVLASIQGEDSDADDFTQYFHVIESTEKVTLYNEQFIIWIVPRMEQEHPTTCVMIALNQSSQPHLEVVFTTDGVYNSPRYVLKVLQHYLVDMLETEATITMIEKSQ